MTFSDIPKGQADTEENTVKETPWGEALRFGALTSEELSKLEIKVRTMLIGGFCFEGDLGFIFAARGLGKTWLGMFLAKCIALGQDACKWEIGSEPKRVLYLDGEMPPADVKMRDLLLGKPTKNLIYVNHEILFDRTGRIMNLTMTDFQEAVLDWCKEEKIQVLFLDNLSTLATGIDENKGIEWEMITPFLMKLRRAHIAVVFIHHAGRGGQMRGHSKREDPSAWILRLDAPRELLEEREGAHFISRFTKWRNASKQPAALEWIFRMKSENEIDIAVETASNMDIFRQLIEDGVNTNKQIADEMDVKPAYVSKMARKAESEGWLKIEKNKYIIIAESRSYSVGADA